MRIMAMIAQNEFPWIGATNENSNFDLGVSRVNRLSPSIHIQILQTDLHTFPS